MQTQERGRGIAGAFCDCAGTRLLGDAEQQVHHQIAPEQAPELLAHFYRIAIEQSGRPSPSHDPTKGGAARLAPYGVEGARHFGRMHRVGDCQSKHRKTVGLLPS